MASINKRIETARKSIEHLRPCSMTVTMTDGTQRAMSPGDAIDLVWKEWGTISKVETDRDDYGELAGLLTALR